MRRDSPRVPGDASRARLPRARSRMPEGPRVVLLPGDSIGPEIAAPARAVLEVLAPDVEIEERLFGGAAIRVTGNPLPDETLEACRSSAAVLKAPIGDP